MSHNAVYTEDMGNNVWLIDIMEQNQPCRTSAYLILDEKVALVETGSAKSHDILLAGMRQLGVTPEKLDYVIVTHVHLDHAGGAGHLMELAPNATLVVHPRGARHMADPSKLWAGARGVYGDELEALFGSIKPVPEDRILIRNHGDTLSLGARTLTFFDSPGHAKHHFTILDDVSNALFAGDAVGIRYRTCFTGWNFEWVMPSTSPIDFDPAAVNATMDMLESVPFDWVYHAHFGKSPKAEAIAGTRQGANAMADFIERVYYEGIPAADVIKGLREWTLEYLKAQGHQPTGYADVLDIDIVLDSLGLIYYQEKR